MDTEEIAKLVQELKLSQAKDTNLVVLSPDLASLGQLSLESCLIGKVFSAKAVNRETFRVQMPRILQAKKGINIEMVGDNLFSLDFSSTADKKRALLDGPWNFFKEMVIFVEPYGLQNPADLLFEDVPLWVQMHNLPIAFMQTDILRTLGKKIGTVLEVEAEDRGLCAGKFARIRIMKKISEPLLKGLYVSTPNSMEEACIVLIHEKLPNFCFGCGNLGHIARDCEDESFDQNDLSFGNWMRAPASPATRRAGNIPRRNTDSNSQSDRQEDTESPSETQQGKCTKLLENIQVNSDTSGHRVSDAEESGPDPVPVDADSNQSETLAPSGNTKGTSNISGKDKEKQVQCMETDFPKQGRKHWKRMARGEMVNQKQLVVKIDDECGNKRSREDQEKLASTSKKPKQNTGLATNSVDELAVAGVQPRQML